MVDVQLTLSFQRFLFCMSSSEHCGCVCVNILVSDRASRVVSAAACTFRQRSCRGSLLNVALMRALLATHCVNISCSMTVFKSFACCWPINMKIFLPSVPCPGPRTSTKKEVLISDTSLCKGQLTMSIFHCVIIQSRRAMEDNPDAVRWFCRILLQNSGSSPSR